MRQATAFKEYFYNCFDCSDKAKFRSFCLNHSVLCILFTAHHEVCAFLVPLCAAKKCCFVSCSSELFSLLSCAAVLGRYSGFHLCGVYTVFSSVCFFICLFFSSSVFWCSVSVHCVFTGVVCFVNVFTFDLLPLTCSVVSYCL